MNGGKGNKKPSPISLQQFISTMAPLIDIEKEAEISASISSGSSRSIDIAQKRGSTILNLKCVDVQEAEISASISSGSSRSIDIAQKRGSTILNVKCVDVQTGLMGKSLLAFQSTRRCSPSTQIWAS